MRPVWSWTRFLVPSWSRIVATPADQGCVDLRNCREAIQLIAHKLTKQKAFTLPFNGPKTTFPKQPETDPCHSHFNKREARNVHHHSYHRSHGVRVRGLSCSRHSILRSAKSTSGRAGALSVKKRGGGSNDNRNNRGRCVCFRFHHRRGNLARTSNGRIARSIRRTARPGDEVDPDTVNCRLLSLAGV
jgi:hypothetical protein